MILQFFQLSGSCLAIQLSHERPSKQSAIKLNVKKNCKHKYPTKNNQLYFLFGFVERHNFLQGRIFQLSDIRASTAMRDIRLIDRVKTTTIDRAERHTRLKYIWTVLVPFIVASRWSLLKSHGLKDRWKNR